MEKIQFRADDEIIARLDNFIDQLQAQGFERVSRSTAARLVFRQALGIEGDTAVSQEVLQQLYGRIYRAMYAVKQDLVERVSAYLQLDDEA